MKRPRSVAETQVDTMSSMKQVAYRSPMRSADTSQGIMRDQRELKSSRSTVDLVDNRQNEQDKHLHKNTKHIVSEETRWLASRVEVVEMCTPRPGMVSGADPPPTASPAASSKDYIGQPSAELIIGLLVGHDVGGAVLEGVRDLPRDVELPGPK